MQLIRNLVKLSNFPTMLSLGLNWESGSTRFLLHIYLQQSEKSGLTHINNNLLKYKTIL